MNFKKFLKASPKGIFSLLLETEEVGGNRERQREGKKEKHQCERETSIDCIPYAPRLGIIGTRTGDGNPNLLVTG